MSDLSERVALVSGSSRGIGFAIGKAMAKEGALVVLVSRSHENLDKAVAEIKEQGGKATGIAAHLGDMEQVAQLVKRVEADIGRLDILVNNFGLNPMHVPLAELPLEVWQKMLNHNLTSYFYLTQQLLQLIRQSKQGRIINISSHAGQMPYTNFGAYCIVKSGIDMMTRVFAKELADEQINVNGIAPGYIETTFHKTRTDIPEEQTLKQIIPIHHIGQPQDVAELACYLASEKSRYMTGEVITLDGGYCSLHG